ncbi:UPF0146 family protein [Salinirubellus salinus]|uniref:UPF0146 protein N0B31_17285 n=1 Tax=Salinirubellus salinus TaxID=1364945 RepID=A0A9E7UA52_9EURY|nr:UPF0146 family protein [Salinirubellus salinus]UWM53868.1 UPF0146 family protein [Salinirubellus salinus]
MSTEPSEALVARLEGHGRAVEVGVGRRPDVARALAARGVDVTATDVHERPTPTEVRFVRDDVTDPTLAHYRGAGVVYALNCPPELQRPLVDVARRVGAECYFTTLGADPAVVPASRESLPGETLFHASGAAADAPAPLRGERP